MQTGYARNYSECLALSSSVFYPTLLPQGAYGSLLLCVDKNVPYIYKQTNSTCAVGFQGNTIPLAAWSDPGQRMLSSYPFPYRLRNFRPTFAVPSFLIFSSIRVNVLSVGAWFPPSILPPPFLSLSLFSSLSLSLSC